MQPGNMYDRKRSIPLPFASEKLFFQANARLPAASEAIQSVKLLLCKRDAERQY